MKFFKPALIILTLVALTFTVSASKISFSKKINDSIQKNAERNPESLPVNGDLLFAFTAIASLGGYMAFKK